MVKKELDKYAEIMKKLVSKSYAFKSKFTS